MGQVSAAAILFMAVSVILSTLLPIGAVIWLAVKKKLSLKSVLWGALLFVVFALGLERYSLHRTVLSAFPQLPLYPYLFALYGGLAAGVFEETARLIGFKWLIRVKADESPYTGISYGLGHGGIEAILLAGINSVYMLVVSLMINSGSVPAGQEALAQQLLSSQPYLFLFTGIERVLAMVIQISLSMIVLKAVTDRKYRSGHHPPRPHRFPGGPVPDRGYPEHTAPGGNGRTLCPGPGVPNVEALHGETARTDGTDIVLQILKSRLSEKAAFLISPL